MHELFVLAALALGRNGGKETIGAEPKHEIIFRRGAQMSHFCVWPLVSGFLRIQLHFEQIGTLLADRHRECDLPLSRAVDLVYQKCTISREGR